MRFILLAATALVACDWPGVACGCSPPYERYEVNGTVTLASGAPVSGANVVANVATTTCATAKPPYTFSPYAAATSNTDGAFVLSLSQYGPFCVRLVAKRSTSADSASTDLDFGASGGTKTVSLRFP
jgi:hypothetical protein